jgi:large subunit ribosomal protein L32
MAEPKRKSSKGRRDRRRSHHVVDTPQLVKCTSCGQMKKAHTVCSSCGKYQKKHENTKGSAPSSPKSSSK